MGSAQRFIQVKVKAGARKASIKEKAPDVFLIAVRAPAEQGLANQSLLNVLSNHLKIPVGRLWIIKGAHSPSKTIEVRG